MGVIDLSETFPIIPIDPNFAEICDLLDTFVALSKSHSRLDLIRPHVLMSFAACLTNDAAYEKCRKLRQGNNTTNTQGPISSSFAECIYAMSISLGQRRSSL